MNAKDNKENSVIIKVKYWLICQWILINFGNINFFAFSHNGLNFEMTCKLIMTKAWHPQSLSRIKTLFPLVLILFPLPLIGVERAGKSTDLN